MSSSDELSSSQESLDDDYDKCQKLLKNSKKLDQDLKELDLLKKVTRNAINESRKLVRKQVLAKKERTRRESEDANSEIEKVNSKLESTKLD